MLERSTYEKAYFWVFGNYRFMFQKIYEASASQIFLNILFAFINRFFFGGGHLKINDGERVAIIDDQKKK